MRWFVWIIAGLLAAASGPVNSPVVADPIDAPAAGPAAAPADDATIVVPPLNAPPAGPATPHTSSTSRTGTGSQSAEISGNSHTDLQPGEVSFRVRMDWSSPTAAAWLGVIELTGGQLSHPESACVSPDDAGTLLLRDSCIWIHRRSPRNNDGCEFNVRGPGTARLTVSLQSSPGGEPVRLNMSVQDLLLKAHSAAIDADGGTITLQRSPDDALQVDSLGHSPIYRPGETVKLLVSYRSPSAETSPQRQPGTLKVRLRSATRRSSENGSDASTESNSDWVNVADATPAADPRSMTFPVSITLPKTEGVYDLDLLAEAQTESTGTAKSTGTADQTDKTANQTIAKGRFSLIAVSSPENVDAIAPDAGVPTTLGGARQVGLYVPGFPTDVAADSRVVENAAVSPPIATARSAFDSGPDRNFVELYAVAQRLLDQTRDEGCNSLMVGSPIHRHPVPENDRPTVRTAARSRLLPETVLQQLAGRAGICVIPELQLSGTLPELEALACEPSTAVGLRLVNAAGRTWSEEHGGEAAAAHYNPLDDRVQRAVTQRLQAMLQESANTPHLRGVAIELSPDGYAMLPGLDWGYDQRTIAAFQRETGIRVFRGNEPFSSVKAHRLLTGTVNERWITWRAARLKNWYAEMAAIVTGSAPGRRLLLTGDRWYADLGNDERLRQALLQGDTLEEWLRSKGLDIAALQQIPGLELVRPWVVADSRSALADALLHSLNRSQPVLEPAAMGGLVYWSPNREPFSAPAIVADPNVRPVIDSIQRSEDVSPVQIAVCDWLSHADITSLWSGSPLVGHATDEQTVALRRIFAQLPPLPLQRVSANLQPVTIRRAVGGDSTWLLLANNSATTSRVVLQLGCSTETAAFQLTGAPHKAVVRMRLLPTESTAESGNVATHANPTAGAPAQIAPEKANIAVSTATANATPNGAAGNDSTLERAASVHGAGNSATSQLVLELAGHDLLALRIAAADVSVSHTAAYVRSQTVQKYEQKLQRLQHKLKLVHQRQTTLRGSRNAHPNIDTAALKTTIVLSENDPPGTAAVIDNEQRTGRKTSPLVTPSVSLSGVRGMTVDVWLRGSRPQTPVRFALQFDTATPDTDRVVQIAAVTASDEWRPYSLAVSELPIQHGPSARLRLELTEPGQLWVEDLRLRCQQLTDDDIRQMTKTIVAARLAVADGRYADVEALLASYWGVFLDGEFADDVRTTDPGRESESGSETGSGTEPVPTRTAAVPDRLPR